MIVLPLELWAIMLHCAHHIFTSKMVKERFTLSSLTNLLLKLLIIGYSDFIFAFTAAISVLGTLEIRPSFYIWLLRIAYTGINWVNTSTNDAEIKYWRRCAGHWFHRWAWSAAVRTACWYLSGIRRIERGFIFVFFGGGVIYLKI